MASLPIFKKIFSPTEARKNSVRFVVLIILCMFRLPLGAVIGFRQISVLLNLAPLGFLIYLAFRAPEGPRKLIQAVWANRICRALIIYIALLSLFFMSMTIHDPFFGLKQVQDALPVTIFLIFPILAYYLFDETELDFIIKWILVFTILIGFALGYLEYNLIATNVLSPKDIYLFLTGTINNQAARINTFMGQGAISNLVILTGYAYFLFSLGQQIFGKMRISSIAHIVLIFLAMVLVLFADSFTLIGIMAALSVITLYYFARHLFLKTKISVPKISLIIVVIYCFWHAARFLVFEKTWFVDRYEAYMVRNEISKALEQYFPQFSGCRLSSLLFGIPFVQRFQETAACSSGEFHGFHLIFTMGLMSQLAWFILLLYPVYAFFKFCVMRTRNENALKFILGALVFDMALVHYAGAEIWGNNYVLALLVVMIIKLLAPSNSKTPDFS